MTGAQAGGELGLEVGEGLRCSVANFWVRSAPSSSAARRRREPSPLAAIASAVQLDVGRSQWSSARHSAARRRARRLDVAQHR